MLRWRWNIGKFNKDYDRNYKNVNGDVNDCVIYKILRIISCLLIVTILFGNDFYYLNFLEMCYPINDTTVILFPGEELLQLCCRADVRLKGIGKLCTPKSVPSTSTHVLSVSTQFSATTPSTTL